jgi:hemolysin activation/secretion protein
MLQASLLPSQKSAGHLKLLIISGYDKGWKWNVVGDTRGQSRANSMGSGIEIILSDAFSYDAALGRQVHAYEIERMVEERGHVNKHAMRCIGVDGQSGVGLPCA